MEFNKEELLKLAKEISTLKELKLTNLPEIDLYMDQITSFMDDKLSLFKRNDMDQILTKTMINNYTKAGILKPPIKKKYSRDHMIELILIYHLKQVLSINDISKLISPISKEPYSEDSSLVKTFELFSEFFISESSSFYEEFEKRLETFEDDELTSDSNNLLLTILILTIRSGLEKRMAEKLIDSYYNMETK